MLTVLFYVLVCMAAIHFIYERILLPSVRLYYRNKLFELRDVVRHQIINSKADDMSATLVVHDALNNAINRLHLMTLTNRVMAQKSLKANPEAQARIRREIELIERTGNKTLFRTIEQSGQILENVLLFNSMMMFLYLLPFIIVAMIVARVVTAVSRFIKPFTERRSLEQVVMLLPDRQVERLVEGERGVFA